MAAKNPYALLRIARSFSKHTSHTGGVVIEDVINKSISDSAKKSTIHIWWDVPTCPVPRNSHAGLIAMNIMKVLRQNQFSGPIEIDGFVCLNRTPRRIANELCAYAALVRSMPSGWDTGLLTDIMMLCVFRPPPLCHVVVSGNREIENALAQLQVRGYDILLLQPGKASSPLPPAEAVWQWRTPNE